MLCSETRALTKDYRVPEKDPGLAGAVASLFNRRYRTTRAVDSISLKIEEGELVGFLGANGAGKTTTLKMLSGLLTPTSGEADVLGNLQRKAAAATRMFEEIVREMQHETGVKRLVYQDTIPSLPPWLATEVATR